MSEKPKFCTTCGEEANPLLWCDLDNTSGEYCIPCFEKTGCEQNHAEDCHTVVWSL